jgi:Co/Zn/Cd efflux system component
VNKRVPLFNYFWPTSRGHFRNCDNVSCFKCPLKAYVIALLITLLVVQAEFWASRATGSLSIESDAWHFLGDGIGYSFAAMLLFLGRPEGLVVRVGMAVFLLASALIIVSEAWGSVGVNHHIIRPDVLFWVTVAGLMVNVVTYKFLRRVLRYQKKRAIHHGNLSHLKADIWFSVGVILIAMLAAMLDQESWVGRADALLSVSVALYLAREAWHIARPHHH